MPEVEARYEARQSLSLTEAIFCPRWDSTTIPEKPEEWFQSRARVAFKSRIDRAPKCVCCWHLIRARFAHTEVARLCPSFPGLVGTRHPAGISAALKPRFTGLVKATCLRPDGRSVSEKGTGPMLLYQCLRKSSTAEGSSKVSEAYRPKPNMLLHKPSPGHRRVIYLT